eukprot:TRINITY_DN113_c0_g1_i6.p1 TRINITY_DN113_c0_g1~~TRINITY_DN113_c0_g1_i6.p1  ORF type:complete len:488 (+),score=193.20 TRINITY_DN113_c0_g1_i6:45-1466(+)
MSEEQVPKNKGVVAIFATIQVVMIILFGTTCSYGDETKMSTQAALANQTTENIDFQTLSVYPLYQDTHVMIYIGFGFLMTFLKKYGLSAVGFNMLLASIMLQWTILVVGFWHRVFKMDGHTFHDRIQLTVASLVGGDFGAAAVLITFGALIGKAGPAQLVVLGLFEIFLYGLNESIGVHEYGAVDMGGSMYVHVFGAFFGLAASYSFMSAQTVEEKDIKKKCSSSRTSDTFAMIGTLFLWMFWPSFNGALASGASKNRVIINTVLSISSSCSAAFLCSYMLRKSGKFSMVDIQNATLAGGVAVGSSSDLVIEAWPALIIGTIAGSLSVIGYVFVQPALENYGLHDTCGVLNLHGMPGLLGGVSGAITAASAGKSLYGHDVGSVFPARANGARSASYQGWMQAACLFTTLGIAIAGGLFGGYMMKFVPDLPAETEESEIFEDSRYWEIEEDEADEEAPAMHKNAKEDPMSEPIY